jgi:hypothetical protein
MGYGFKVIRVHASTIPAEMVKFEAIRDWPSHCLIENTMSIPLGL